MKVKIQGGSGTLELADATFGVAFNEPLVHQVVTAYLAAGRAGTKAQKNRSDVSGSGKKPWKQKGTGRARVGSIRSPLWVGGGRTFAARPRSFEQKVNRKMYRGALRSVLSELVRQERLVVAGELGLTAAKTKELRVKLEGLGFAAGLVIVDAFDRNLWLAARNLPGVEVVEAKTVDPVALVGAAKVVATAAALKIIEERLQ
jgi:large subunit ribosomal protein L4